MGFIERFAQKAAITAKDTVSDSVKEDVKKATVDAVPALIAVGTVLFGLLVFKNPGGGRGMKRIPTMSTTHIITNNYFFDDKTKKEIISQLIQK